MGDDIKKREPGQALARTAAETGHALQRIVSGKAPNEEVYWCMSCGFATDPNDPSKVAYPSGLTLKFDEDEIEALGGDLSAYTGPCPCCNYMGLVPMDKFTGETIRGRSKENREAEYKQQAHAFVDVVKEELASGSIFSGAMEEPHAGGDGAPGQRDDLPDADDIDDGDLKPRGS